MTKIIGLANSCKECLNSHYYSSGTYECLKVSGSRLNADSSIPQWCPLQDYAIASRPAADESAKPYYTIERRDSSPTVWWSGPVWADMTAKIKHAHRFASRAEAEAKLRVWTDHSLFVSEHVDIPSMRASGMEQAFSSSAMGRRDDLALADRHAETPLLLELLGVPLIDGIANYCIRIKLERALAAQSEAAPVASKEAVKVPKSFGVIDEQIPYVVELGNWLAGTERPTTKPDSSTLHVRALAQRDASKEAVTLSDEEIVAAIRVAGAHDGEWKALTFDSGPYEITTPNRFTRSFVDGIVALAQRDASKAEGQSC